MVKHKKMYALKKCKEAEIHMNIKLDLWCTKWEHGNWTSGICWTRGLWDRVVKSSGFPKEKWGKRVDLWQCGEQSGLSLVLRYQQYPCSPGLYSLWGRNMYNHSHYRMGLRVESEGGRPGIRDTFLFINLESWVQEFYFYIWPPWCYKG